MSIRLQLQQGTQPSLTAMYAFDRRKVCELERGAYKRERGSTPARHVAHTVGAESRKAQREAGTASASERDWYYELSKTCVGA